MTTKTELSAIAAAATMGLSRPAETCAEDGPNVITDVATIPATSDDRQALAGPEPARVHQREGRHRLPPPRGLGLECRCRREEQLDLPGAEQVGARRTNGAFQRPDST